MARNQRGSSFIFLLAMIVVVVGSTIFSNMNNNHLELRIAQKSIAKTRFNFLVNSIESAIINNCQTALAGHPIDVDIGATGIDFQSNLTTGGLDPITILRPNDHFKGFRIARMALERNTDYSRDYDPNFMAIPVKGLFLVIEGELNEPIAIGGDQLYYRIPITAKIDGSNQITDCVAAGSLNENCWMVGIDNKDCTRNQWLAVAYTKMCYSFMADLANDPGDCTDGTDPWACCDPNHPTQSIQLIDALWQEAFPTPTP